MNRRQRSARNSWLPSTLMSIGGPIAKIHPLRLVVCIVCALLLGSVYRFQSLVLEASGTVSSTTSTSSSPWWLYDSVHLVPWMQSSTKSTHFNHDKPPVGSNSTNATVTVASTATTAAVHVRTLPNISNIVFLHVGKAGGETIKAILRIGCESRKSKPRRRKCFRHLPKSRLGEMVNVYYHCFETTKSVATITTITASQGGNHPPNKPPQQNRSGSKKSTTADAYLINIRHPADRALSWYHYIHPQNCVIPGSHAQACLVAEKIARGVSNNATIIQGTTEANNGNNSKKKKSFHKEMESIRWITQFFDCFPTAQEWIVASVPNQTVTTRQVNGSSLRSASSVESGTRCATLAQRTFQGNWSHLEIPFAAHMIANYQHYYQQIPENAAAAAATATISSTQTITPVLLVVRTDFLWDDIKKIDQSLGGTGDFGEMEGRAVTHGSQHHVHKKDDLPNEFVQLLCCQLMDEMQVYHTIIQKAANWDESTRQLEWDRALSRCVVTSWFELITACARMT